MFDVIEKKNSFLISTNLDNFKILQKNASNIFYEDDELIIDINRINNLFSSYGANKFIKDDKYHIEIAKNKNLNFNVINNRSSKYLYDYLYKDSILNRPFFLKNIMLPSLDLKDYQIEGISWLKESPSRLLADDMGLGKTLQAIAAAASLISDGKISSVLILCPTSLVFNWCYEINKWLPDFSVSQITNTGPGEKQNKVWNSLFNSAHFIVSSYDHFRDLPEIFKYEKVELLIADEAHKLRKSTSKIHKSAQSIDSERFWALSGTPIEHDSSDLINILTLLDKKLDALTLKSFNEIYLSGLADEYLLRRMKNDVLGEMRGFDEQTHYLEMTNQQKKNYQVLEAKFRKPNNKDQLKIFGQLKQTCDFDEISSSGIKINYSIEMIEKIIINNEKIVIFSFWLSPLKQLNTLLHEKYNQNFSIVYDGSLDKDEKEEVLNKFKTDQTCYVLLCSGKIGGEGLNLTEANHMIFINSWWNPSNNNQARDRIVRIGQDKKCFIHNLRTVDTIETRIDEILKDKNNITDLVIESLVRESYSSERK
jgi:SNF2 family DNA or RNA helicase